MEPLRQLRARKRHGRWSGQSVLGHVVDRLKRHGGAHEFPGREQYDIQSRGTRERGCA